MSKKCCFSGLFYKQHGKRTQALLKYAEHYRFHIYWSLPNHLSWKKFLLLTCQILGLSVNTFAANEKYPVFKRENLTIPIQMQLSEKQKNFCQMFTSILKSRWIFEHFDKKDDTHRFCISEIRNSGNVVR